MPADATRGLNNITVLVTRPRHQAEELSALITAGGGEVLHLPVLEIVPLPESHDAARAAAILIQQLTAIDIAIFISANAVEQADACVRRQLGRWPENLQLAVVGQNSAQALSRMGLSADICPARDFNSEALLALPVMQQVQDKRIVIFRGLGGREKLASELRRRGARVDYAEVYQRRCPDTDLHKLRSDGRLQRINAIVVASNESLQNLYAIAGTTERNWLLKTPLAVISQRCAVLAKDLGFHHYCVATEANSQGLVEAVQQCCVKSGTKIGAGNEHDGTR